MKTLFLILISVLVLSCEKTFLDTSPQGLINKGDFYKTDADATSAVASAYQMLEAINASPWNSLWMMKELPSGDILCGGGQRGDQPPYEEIAEFRYGSDNTVITKAYSMAYYTIQRTNLVIDNVQPDNAYKKAVIAEAKTIRAFMYFDLVTLWGSVPLVLHNLELGNYQQPQNTISEIWTQIEKDLTEAIPDLPVKSQMKTAKLDVSRISKGTAQSLLGKALLYEKKNAQAAAQFQTVIDSKEYDLVPDYARVLRKDTEFGIESVFEVSYSSDQNNTWNTTNIWGNPGRTVHDNVHWQLTGPRGDDWFKSGNSGINAGWGFASPTLELYYSYVNNGDSIRKHVAIMDEKELIALGGKLRSASNNSYPYGSAGLIRLKYGTWADETTPANSSATAERNYGTNLRVIRYADVLLMAAEAYLLDGKPDKAIPLFNLVHQRAKLTPVTTLTLANIKTERKLEFSFEGIRFQDLLRWGDAATELANFGKYYYLGTFKNGVEEKIDVQGGGFKQKNVYFPIPYVELMTNPKMNPTPGY